MIHLDNNSWSDIYDYNVASWKKLYKDCDFKIWGFEDVKDIIEQSEWCKVHYDIFLKTKKSLALAFISDYLRLYLLNKYGGLYVDTDVFALNRMPDYLFKDNDLIVTWDPGTRTSKYESDFIKKYNIEKTNLQAFWREVRSPAINNGAFLFSKENNNVLIKEIRKRNYYAKFCSLSHGLYCLSLINTLQEHIKFNEEQDYQKILNQNDILILNSNFNAFEPEECYFDYKPNDKIYNVHQCLTTGYNGPVKYKDLNKSFKEAFEIISKFSFKKEHMIFIPVDNDNIEDFNEFSYYLRRLLGPKNKFDFFRIKPMPKL